MSYPWSSAQLTAIAELAKYNGGVYNATSNPYGFAGGGHYTIFTPSLNYASTAANAIKDAADFAGAKADAAATSASAAAQTIANLSGTSTTSLTIGQGSKTLTTQAGKSFEPGRAVRLVSVSNPMTAYMVGKVSAYSGTALTVNVLLAIGTGSAADWNILVEGEVGSAGTLTLGTVSTLFSDQSATATNVGTAAAAQINLGIPKGSPSGLPYTWSSDTSATDPGAGKLKVGSASLTTATSLYISETDRLAVAESAVIASWDDSTNPVRGQLRIEDVRNPANFVVFNVVGALVDNGSWNTLPIAYVDKGGTLIDAVNVRLDFRTAGDKGNPGANGNDGAAASITVRTTTTGAAGSAASVTNAGTANAAVLDFVVPRGGVGATGPVVATRYNFDTVTSDADPGNGNVRFNNATTSSVTLILLDNVEATGGITMTGFIDTFDDSTNPSGKGVLTFKDVNDQSKFAIYVVTGAVVDGSGYRKVPVTWLAGTGGFTAGANLGMTFDRAGDKGADGGGAGNVVGPASATDGGFALFSGTTGKLLQSGQVPGALAYKANVNNNDWSGAALTIGNGGTGATTVSQAQQNLTLVPGTHVQAYSAKLMAIDGATWAANTAPYYTSATQIGTYTLTAFGRSLAGSADAGAAQTTLQLVIGTNVQAFSSVLQALAGLTLAANKGIYATSATAVATYDTTTFGRSLVGVADAPAARTALALGTASTANTGTAAGSIALLQTGGVFDAATQPQITGGDVTAPAGSAVHSLTTTGITAGSYVLSTITFDAKGRATSAVQGALTGDVTTTAGSFTTTLATVNASPGTYAYANVTVNAKGLVTAVTAGTAPPTKAAGSDVRTLTDDAKFLTAKSLADGMAFTTPAWAASFAPNWSTFGFNQSLLAGGNTTLTGPFTGGTDGEPIIIEYIQDGTGGRTLAFNTTYFKIPPALTITASTAANARDQLYGKLRNRSGTIVCEVSGFDKAVP